MFLRPQGYARLLEQDKTTVVLEADTYTCQHCQRIVHVQPREDPSSLGSCPNCRDKKTLGLICPRCADKMARGGGCVPFELVLEEIEARGRVLRSYGL